MAPKCCQGEKQSWGKMMRPLKKARCYLIVQEKIDANLCSGGKHNGPGIMRPVPLESL
jgi:hypothetical protein